MHKDEGQDGKPDVDAPWRKSPPLLPVPSYFHGKVDGAGQGMTANTYGNPGKLAAAVGDTRQLAKAPAKPQLTARDKAQKLMELIDHGQRLGRLSKAEKEYFERRKGISANNTPLEQQPHDVGPGSMPNTFKTIRSLAERVAMAQGAGPLQSKVQSGDATSSNLEYYLAKGQEFWLKHQAEHGIVPPVKPKASAEVKADGSLKIELPLDATNDDSKTSAEVKADGVFNFELPGAAAIQRHPAEAVRLASTDCAEQPELQEWDRFLQVRLTEEDEAAKEAAKTIASLRRLISSMREYMELLTCDASFHEPDMQKRLALHRRIIEQTHRERESRFGWGKIQYTFPGLKFTNFEREMMMELAAELSKCTSLDAACKFAVRIKGEVVHDPPISRTRSRHLQTEEPVVLAEIVGSAFHISLLEEFFCETPIHLRGFEGVSRGWTRPRSTGSTITVVIAMCEGLGEALDREELLPGCSKSSGLFEHQRSFVVASIIGKDELRLQTPASTGVWNFKGEISGVSPGDVLKLSLHADDGSTDCLGYCELSLVRLVLPGSRFHGAVPLFAPRNRPSLHLSIFGPDTKPKPGLDVLFLSASHLPWIDDERQGRGPDPYCICSVLPKDPEHASGTFLKTRTVQACLHPVWGQGGRIAAQPGDRLEFRIYAARASGVVQTEGDEFLGSAIVATDEISHRPFFGEVELSNGPILPGVLPKPVVKTRIDVSANGTYEPQAANGEVDVKCSVATMPSVLWVKVAPCNDFYHSPLSGVYTLELLSMDGGPGEPRKVRGMPVWKQEGGIRYIFSGLSGHWFFGDAQEEEKEFNADTGLLCSIMPHKGAMPDEMYNRATGGWKMYVRRHWCHAASTVITRREPDKALVPNIWSAYPEIRDKLRFACYCENMELLASMKARIRSALGDDVREFTDYEFVYMLRQQFLIPRTSCTDEMITDLFSILSCVRWQDGKPVRSETMALERFLRYVEWTLANDRPLPVTGPVMTPDLKLAQALIRKAIRYNTIPPHVAHSETLWSLPLARYRWMQSEVAKLTKVFDIPDRNGKLSFDELTRVMRSELNIPVHTWPDSKMEKLHVTLRRHGETDVDVCSIIDLVDPELRLVQREVERGLQLQVLDEGIFPDPGMEVSSSNGADCGFYLETENAASHLQMVFLVGDARACFRERRLGAGSDIVDGGPKTSVGDNDHRCSIDPWLSEDDDALAGGQPSDLNTSGRVLGGALLS